MKKLLFISLCLFGGIGFANAQLKVHENGYVSIQNTSNSALSPLSIGNSGTSDYLISGTTNHGGGMNLYIGNTHSGSPANYLYGVFSQNYGYSLKNIAIRGLGYANTQVNSSSPSCIGVNGVGYAATNPTSIAYGVLGHVSATKGVGVCGASNLYGTDTNVDGCYAGLFIGETKVLGNLTVTGSISGTMLSSPLPENALQVEPIQSDRSSILNRLATIETLSYYHAPETKANVAEHDNTLLEEELASNPELKALLADAKEPEPEKDVLEEQRVSKKHYALTVEQLEKVFPELVYEDKNGAKHVNYMEMIPLLVQSINELRAQLNALTGSESVKQARAASLTDDEDNTATQVSTTEAHISRLFQNTPNPFTERTEIRFSLADDAQNAYIYVFDMQGKMLRQIPVDPSMQSVTINGYDLQAGIYLYSLAVNGQEIDTKRMILSK